MKAQKIITIITVILLIAIITSASILGIYKKQEYKVTDIVPKYILGMEFTKSRIIDIKVDKSNESTTIYDKDGNEVTEKQDGVEYTEENGYTVVENKVNKDEVLTQENYKLSKKILESRLKDLKAEQYNIKQNTNTGDIQIELTEDDNTETIISNLAQKGVFELTDNETNEVLLDNSYIQKTSVVYSQTDAGNTVFLQIKFNNEGKKKLEDISKTYIATTTQEENENGELEDKTETKEVAIVFDGQTYRTTYFGDTIEDGNLNVAIGSANDSAVLQQYSDVAMQMSTVLNSGVLPITYNVSGYTVSPVIEESELNIIMYIAIAVLVIISIYIVIKLKLKGILAIILQVGYISLLLLALRYTNIKITLEGLVGIAISILLNYMYIYSAFKNLENDFVKDTTAKFALKLTPIYIIAIAFTFNVIANISSLGMTLVWGIITMYLYNLILTQLTVRTIEEK